MNVVTLWLLLPQPIWCLWRVLVTVRILLDETTRLVETLVVENASLEKKVKNLVVELS